MSRPLRVLFPDSGAENPYMELLTAALRAEGVDVVVARPYRHLGVIRAVRHARPDIVHLQWHHGYFTARNMLFARVNTLLFRLQRAALRARRIRVVWTVHELVNHAQWQAEWELSAARQLARSADAVVVHSDSSAAVVAAETGVPLRRLHVTPHGSYIGRYPELSREEARARLGIPGGDRLLLFFGAVRRHKGLDALLRAFRTIPDTRARLVVMGEAEKPELAHELETLRAGDSRITLDLRYADDTDLAAHIAACDFVVLPHRSVLTSGSAILAASCSRAPVMPRLACMREFPEDAAVLYESGSEHALQQALQVAVSEDPDARGAAARTWIEQFTWQRTAAATLAVYDAVMGSR